MTVIRTTEKQANFFQIADFCKTVTKVADLIFAEAADLSEKSKFTDKLYYAPEKGKTNQKSFLNVFPNKLTFIKVIQIKR